MLPQSMMQRQYIIGVIEHVFKKYGFQPIETPAFEKVETLTGKYGEEGDRLIFKILPRGEKLKAAVEKGEEQALLNKVDEALRYDLTVPFARFVVQNQNDLNFPFKRYQIQPVWRADRPQKGRFREFYQCDADVVGSHSLLQEIEFVAIYTEVLSQLKLPFLIKLNNRKILAGITEKLGIPDRFSEFTVALDKLDKIGLEGVKKELEQKDFKPEVLGTLEDIVTIKGSNHQVINKLSALVEGNEIGESGLSEVSFLVEQCKNLGLEQHLQIDLTLARGLDYYTGAIFEVAAQGVALGSIGGGGRYDDLTGIFGMKNLPGIGISFGLDRIQLALDELKLFPDLEAQSTEVLFVNFGEKEALYSMSIAHELRKINVKTEVYPDKAKLKKQLDYANKKGIAAVVMIGEKEIDEGRFALKNMKSGEQQKMRKIELLEYFSAEKNSSYGRH